MGAQDCARGWGLAAHFPAVPPPPERRARSTALPSRPFGTLLFQNGTLVPSAIAPMARFMKRRSRPFMPQMAQEYRVMSLKHLMFLTSSLATAGLAVSAQQAQAGGLNQHGTWGKPLDASKGVSGLECGLDLPQVQHPQAVGPVSVPPVSNNFGTRSSAGFNVARPQSVQGHVSAPAEDAARPSLFNGSLNVQRPNGVNMGNGNSGPVNAYRPNSSNLNVVRPNGAEVNAETHQTVESMRPRQPLNVEGGNRNAGRAMPPTGPVQFNHNLDVTSSDRSRSTVQSMAPSRPVTVNRGLRGSSNKDSGAGTPITVGRPVNLDRNVENSHGGSSRLDNARSI